MKRLKEIVCGALIFITAPVGAQEVAADYEIAKWQGFRSSAVCYTFDDLCPNQLKIAVPLFDSYAYKLTLYPISSWDNDWEALRAAAANGHEVGSHSVTHPRLNALTTAKQDEELSMSKKIIEERTGIACVTLAYPYCIAGDFTVTGKYYAAARSCSPRIVPSTPDDYYTIPSIVCGELGQINTLTAFEEWFKAAAEVKGWCVLVLHGIDDDGGYSPLSSGLLRQSVEYLHLYENLYWVTSFRDAVLYSKERDCASIKEVRRSASSLSVEITDGLDNSVYNCPITVRRRLPNGWKNVEIRQNNEPVPSVVTTDGQARFVTFNVIPDSGLLHINKR